LSRRKNSSALVVLLVLVAFIAGSLYIYFSDTFERNKPTITLAANNGYWNLKKPLEITIEDSSGIRSYKVSILMDAKKKVLEYEKPLAMPQQVAIEVKPPRTLYTLKAKRVTIVVEAQDSSKWNFFDGNRIEKRFELIIDKKRPRLNIVNNSYKISRGGSALVIFKVEDENLDKLYIESNKRHFKAEPFYKEGYYIALLAWPVTQRHFKATVIATDLAGNRATAYVPLYLKNRKYRVSKIKLSDKFLKGKIYDLAEEFEETQGVEDKIEQFKIINEDVRAKNEKLIHKITSVVPQDMIDDFHIRKMYPLKNGAVVAHFGDHRKYYYKGKLVSEAYHLGLDMASHSMAAIKTQNGGKVVYANYNGLYGNMPILSHGLGLYTLYGHCSSVDVSEGEEVAPNSKIANTGKTGYAMGDHLHFGVLVQGVEVRPQEWMDRKWIKLNISDIIKSAKKIIDEE